MKEAINIEDGLGARIFKRLYALSKGCNKLNIIGLLKCKQKRGKMNTQRRTGNARKNTGVSELKHPAKKPQGKQEVWGEG